MILQTSQPNRKPSQELHPHLQQGPTALSSMVACLASIGTIQKLKAIYNEVNQLS